MNAEFGQLDEIKSRTLTNIVQTLINGLHNGNEAFEVQVYDEKTEEFLPRILSGEKISEVIEMPFYFSPDMNFITTDLKILDPFLQQIKPRISENYAEKVDHYYSRYQKLTKQEMS